MLKKTKYSDIIHIGGVIMLTSKSFGPFNLPKPAIEGISLGALAAVLVLEIDRKSTRLNSSH